jgi:branched-chain amino acid transport system substrate-binding protein
MKRNLCTFVRAAMVVAVAGTAMMAMPSFAQNTIKIGLITDKVGVAKAYAEPVASGVTFAVKELNAKGGILGKQIEFLVE